MAPVKIQRDKEGEEEKQTKKTALTILQQMLKTKRFLSGWTISPTMISLFIWSAESCILDRKFQWWQAQGRGQVTKEPGEALTCEQVTKEAEA